MAAEEEERAVVGVAVVVVEPHHQPPAQGQEPLRRRRQPPGFYAWDLDEDHSAFEDSLSSLVLMGGWMGGAESLGKATYARLSY